MITINEQKLKACLLKEGYIEANGLDSTISHLLGMQEEAKQMLLEWMNEGKVPEFASINGIDSHILRDTLRMKEPAIILSYNMLLIDPIRNSAILKGLLSRRKMYKRQNG